MLKMRAATKRRLRPKLDVVFELGFLLGKLGKDHVLVFFRECANFEIPVDFEGIKFAALMIGIAGNLHSYVNFPTAGWQLTVTKS